MTLDVREFLQCPICFERFQHPKILPCLHSFCNKCLNRVVVRDRVECPICRSSCNASKDIKNDFRTQQLLDCSVITPSAPLLSEVSFDRSNRTLTSPRSPPRRITRNINTIPDKRKIYLVGSIVLGIIVLSILLILFKSMNKWIDRSCAPTQYWNGQLCLSKRHLNESCNETSECNDAQALSCINQTCTCYHYYAYYDLKLQKCQLKSIDGEACTVSYVCLTPMMCRNRTCKCEINEYFDEQNQECRTIKTTESSCTVNQYWNGQKCVPKGHFKEFCNQSAQCSDAQSLSCINQTCTCHQEYAYYDFDLAKCQSKLNEGAACTVSYMCLTPMMCRNRKCQCEINEYFDESKHECHIQKGLLEKCKIDSTCRTDLDLICIENKCDCDSKTKFWSKLKKRCIDYLTNDELGCTRDDDCYGNLICTSNKQCKCTPHEYYDEFKKECLNKSDFLEPCFTNEACKLSLDLVCIENKCNCDPTSKFWSDRENKCVNLLSYGQLGCSSESNCHGNLICNTNPLENNCSCPQESQIGMCDCTRKSDQQFYWNGKECAKASQIFSKCTDDYECETPYFCLHKLSTCSPGYQFFKSVFRNTSPKIFNWYFSFTLLTFTMFI